MRRAGSDARLNHLRAMKGKTMSTDGCKAKWKAAEHYRPRAPHGAGLRSWGVGICIDPQCTDGSHFGVASKAKKQPTRTEATILAIVDVAIRDCNHWLQLARQAGDGL